MNKTSIFVFCIVLSFSNVFGMDILDYELKERLSLYMGVYTWDFLPLRDLEKGDLVEIYFTISTDFNHKFNLSFCVINEVYSNANETISRINISNFKVSIFNLTDYSKCIASKNYSSSGNFSFTIEESGTYIFFVFGDSFYGDCKGVDVYYSVKEEEKDVSLWEEFVELVYSLIFAVAFAIISYVVLYVNYKNHEKDILSGNKCIDFLFVLIFLTFEYFSFFEYVFGSKTFFKTMRFGFRLFLVIILFSKRFLHSEEKIVKNQKVVFNE